MQEREKTVTYDNIGSIDIEEQVHQFLLGRDKKDDSIITEIKIHRSYLGYPLMTVVTMSSQDLP